MAHKNERCQKHTIDYDLNGSTIKDETGTNSAVRSYIYDAMDRLVEVKDGGQTIEKYAYDPMDRRVRRQTFGANSNDIWFLYSNEGLIGEYGATNSIVREYGWQPDGYWSTDPVWSKTSDRIVILQNDKIGSSDVLTSAIDGQET